MAHQVLRISDVQKRLGFGSRTSVFLLSRDDPSFPTPIRLGKRARGFIASEIDAWIESQRAPRAADRD